MNQYPKRLIEVDLPIKRISAHARREKSIRHGHISTLHIWWARRPLAACRAVICASLWFDPADEKCPESFLVTARDEMRKWGRDHRDVMSAESFSRFEAANKDPKKYESSENLRSLLLDFIADFANWDNSRNGAYLKTSRVLTEAAHVANGGFASTRPLVVDPFAGGGSIPLEALRVGADAFASDLNPVPVLLNKVTLEYIPKYGQLLAEEVRKWAKWVESEAENELAKFYPLEADGSKPTGYLWARTVLSEAPGEDETPVEIPLFRSMWLSSKPQRRFAFRWLRDKSGRVRTETVEVNYTDGSVRKVRRPLLEVFQPASPADVEKGTSSGGAATCPVSGHTTPVERVREQLKARAGGGADARLLSVITTSGNGSGKRYRHPAIGDLEARKAATDELFRRIQQHQSEVALIPDGKLNHLRGFFNVVLYGMETWGDLFTPRQALSLCYIADRIKEVGENFENKEFGVAVQTCLAMSLGRCADKCASVVVWNIPAEKIEHVFGRQALPMVWDFAEANILSSIGWTGACEWVLKVIEHNSAALMPIGIATTASATCQPLPDDSADALITDPPYYAAIPYADLSDFFYSWFKRTVGEIHPDLFHSDLSPKEDECVQLSHRAAMYRHKDGAWFEETMTRACVENRRITKPSGISVVVFANKETSGWEAMLAALIESGWVITASWPIDTEMGTRLRAQNSAALASSIHLVCRPRENTDGSLRDVVGDWREVLRELPVRISEWMPRLANEGVVGADAIFACVGPALEIFSRYSTVEKPSGEKVNLREYLEYVWAAVAKEALNMIFSGADATGFEEDARLSAMWLWTLFAGAPTTDGSEASGETDEIDEEETGKSAKTKGYVLESSVAFQLAQGIGANLDRLSSIIEVKGEKARLLPVGERARDLFGYVESSATEKKRKTKAQKKLFEEMEEFDYESTTGIGGAPEAGATTLDRIHQTMLLFGAGRSEAVRRFLVNDGVGNDERFWRLANALSALYPSGTDEKRWVDGVLARKKGLGF